MLDVSSTCTDKFACRSRCLEGQGGRRCWVCLLCFSLVGRGRGTIDNLLNALRTHSSEHHSPLAESVWRTRPPRYCQEAQRTTRAYCAGGKRERTPGQRILPTPHLTSSCSKQLQVPPVSHPQRFRAISRYAISRYFTHSIAQEQPQPARQSGPRRRTYRVWPCTAAIVARLAVHVAKIAVQPDVAARKMSPNGALEQLCSKPLSAKVYGVGRDGRAEGARGLAQSRRAAVVSPKTRGRSVGATRGAFASGSLGN